MTTLPLLDSARRMGQLAWCCRQGFTLFGGWAGDDRTASLARTFGTLSNECSAVAATCVDRLPTIALTSGETVAPEQFVVAPDADDERLVSEMIDVTDLDGRRSAARRLLQRVAAIADEHRSLVDPTLDEPTVAVLDDVSRVVAAGLARLDG